MNFLPNNYEAPKSGGHYMKIQQGENKIRILSQPILGWEEWTKDKKPVRYFFDKKPEKAMHSNEPLKHFWSFIVWNYNEAQIQILHVTQAGIRKGIESLCNDADWGAPFFYDIKIFKEGEDKTTKYQVNPLPHKPVAPHIIDAYVAKPCYLDAIYTNADPFASGYNKKTPGIFSQDKMEIREESKAETMPQSTISQMQAEELEQLLMKCSPEYRKTINDTLRKPPINVSRLQDIPMAYYDRLKLAAINKANEFASQYDIFAEAS